MRSTTAPWLRTRRAHCLLKRCSDEAIRVPPDQSATSAEQAASASSGSRWRMARVTLVSRVPNKNVVTRLRASVTACRKCRNKPRVFAHRSRNIQKSHDRRFFYARAEIFQIDHRATRLHAGAQACGEYRSDDRGGLRPSAVCELHRAATSDARNGFFRCRNFRSSHLRKVFLLKHFVVGNRQPCVDFHFGFVRSSLVKTGK